jgi:hypothetical protein
MLTERHYLDWLHMNSSVSRRDRMVVVFTTIYAIIVH